MSLVLTKLLIVNMLNFLHWEVMQYLKKLQVPIININN